MSRIICFMQNLPKRLKEARKNADLSQTKMSRLLNVSANTTSAIENGDARELKLGTIHDYARLTNTPLAYLIFGEDYLDMTLHRIEEAREVINRTLDTTTNAIRDDQQKLLPRKK